MSSTRRARNDLAQYDDLVDEWWDVRGAFAMLHWIAKARCALVPRPTRDGAIVVDLGAGAGLSAPYLAEKGYRHVGVDLVSSAITLAASHGVRALRADVRAVPLADGCADVVLAGEILEHVAPVDAVVAEACRVLRPGGTLVLDTIANTAIARLAVVVLAERIPGGAPPGIHDPHLFVSRSALVASCARRGVELSLFGLRPSFSSLATYLFHRAGAAKMVRSRSTAVLFQGVGVKSS